MLGMIKWELGNKIENGIIQLANLSSTHVLTKRTVLSILP